MNSSYLGFERLEHDPNFEIALNMSLDQLRFYCTSNEQFKTICMDQEFWLRRLRREHPTLLSYKPPNFTWAQYYNALEIGSIKIVDVAYNGRIVGKIIMHSTDTSVEVMQRAVNLLIAYPAFDSDMTEMDFMKIATGPTSSYQDVIIESGPTRYALKSRPQPVQDNWGPTTNLLRDLQVIHIYDRDLYPRGEEIVFKKS